MSRDVSAGLRRTLRKLWAFLLDSRQPCCLSLELLCYQSAQSLLLTYTSSEIAVHMAQHNGEELPLGLHRPSTSSSVSAPPPYESRQPHHRADEKGQASASHPKHNETEAQRLAALQQWAREKEYSNDYYGGIKGAVGSQPTDPFKFFRAKGESGEHNIEPGRGRSLAERLHLSHHKDQVKGEDNEKSNETQDKYAVDGQVAKGDVESYQVL